MASRRLPLPAVLAATALALVAALAVFSLADAGDSGDSRGAATGGRAADGGYELAPQGELPASIADVRLGSLGDGPDALLGDLLTGKPMVLNFFASWCRPCVTEMPAIESVHRSLGDRLAVVGLANQDDAAAALETVAVTGVTYPTYADPSGDSLTYFGGMAMPTTVFIAADGTVVDVASGELSEAELRGRIERLLGVAS